MYRRAMVLAGHGLVGLGVVGAFVPVMPTTIFLILAAACYARGNPLLHQRLLAHPRFGPALRDWEEHRAMSPRAKATAIATIIVGIGATILWGVTAMWLRLLLGGIALALIGYLLSIRRR
jgi:uncharacterized membrane protein YbaN (DUF454 family)